MQWRILDPAHRDQMKKAMADLNRSNGAAEVADFFTEMLIV